jgi:hypothetical protein
VDSSIPESGGGGGGGLVVVMLRGTERKWWNVGIFVMSFY